MANIVVDDRRASREEIVAHQAKLMELAEQRGLTNLRVRDDGALLVTAPEPGYRAVARFGGRASEIVGAHVYVITDDTPGTNTTSVPL